MAAPSVEEQHLIKEFRHRVEDVLRTPEQRGELYLLRWLRARDLNLDKAEGMLRNSLNWRQENGLDTILTKPFDPWMRSTYPFWGNGRDIDGRAVLVVPIGTWDMRKAIDKGESKGFEEYINQAFETILEFIRQSNKDKKEGEHPHTQITIVADWNHYSYGQLIHLKALQSILKMASTYEAHYPEIVYRAFFVNTPSIFPMVMKVLKPILAEKTYLKISCHSNQKEWQPLVEELVRKDQLPPCVGGTHPIDV